jgi:hypothetical protein
MVVQTYRIVTACVATAVCAARAAIATRYDDEGSTRVIVGVRVTDGPYEAVVMPAAKWIEMLRESCQEESLSNPWLPVVAAISPTPDGRDPVDGGRSTLAR